MQSVEALPGAAATARPSRGWLRARVATTPGRLTLISVLVVVSAVCFGVVATAAEHSRAHAAQAAKASTERLLAQAATLYTKLSDANATATTTFLKGGLEPLALRQQYLNDLRSASDALAGLTREVSGSAAARELTTLNELLPIYAGRIESARADNRFGLPIGAAYLRSASTLLTGRILPSADRLYAIEANRLTNDYATGTNAVALVVLIFAIVLALGLLIIGQLYVFRISHRILNIGMLAATVALAAVSVWSVVGLIGEQNALARARHESDLVEVLSATKVLLSRAQTDQSLTLVNRGSDKTDPTDFIHMRQALAPPGGLLGELGTLAGPNGASSAAGLITQFDAYVQNAQQIPRLEQSGGLTAAIARADTGSSIAADLSSTLGRRITAAQARFESEAASATSAIAGLEIAIPVLTALAAALALLGLRARLEEYR
jgi:hypothetical protein